MLKITFEKPTIPIADSVKHIFQKRRGSAKKAPDKKWTYKERFIVGALLAATVGLSFYFWYTSEQAPKFDFGFFSFNNTVVIKK